MHMCVCVYVYVYVYVYMLICVHSRVFISSIPKFHLSPLVSTYIHTHIYTLYWQHKYSDWKQVIKAYAMREISVDDVIDALADLEEGGHVTGNAWHETLRLRISSVISKKRSFLSFLCLLCKFEGKVSSVYLICF